MKTMKKLVSVILAVCMIVSTMVCLGVTASAADYDSQGRPLSEDLFYADLDKDKTTIIGKIWIVSRPEGLKGTPWELSQASPITLKLRDDVNVPQLRFSWLNFETKKNAPFTDSGYVLLNDGYAGRKVLATYPVNAEGYEVGGQAFSYGSISIDDMIAYKTVGIHLTVTGDARYGVGNQGVGRLLDTDVEYHDATEEIDFNSEGHWYVCSAGGSCRFGCTCNADSELIKPVPHTYGDDYVCTVCGYIDPSKKDVYTAEFTLPDWEGDGPFPMQYTDNGFKLNGNYCNEIDKRYAFTICPYEGYENYMDVDVPTGAKLLGVTVYYGENDYGELFITDLGTDVENMPSTGRQIDTANHCVHLSTIGLTDEDNVIISSRDYEGAEMYPTKVVLTFKHVVADAYTYNETQHWHACTFDGCEDLHNTVENHTFVDRVCKCGATLPAPTLKVSCSLVLDGYIGSKIYMNLDDVDATYITVNYNQAIETYASDFVTKTLQKSELTKEDDGRYSYIVWQNPAQIAEDITVSVFGADGQIDETKTVSGKKYADAVMAGDFSAKVKNLCNAMVVYGAECQSQFADYTGAAIDLGTTYTKDFSHVVYPYAEVAKTGAVTGIAPKSLSFLTLSGSTLRVSFKGNLAGATVTVDGVAAKVNTTYNYVDVTGIAARDLDKPMDVTVTVGGETLTVTLSAMSYVMAAKGQASLANVCAAIALYNQAADAYFA